MYTDAEFGRFLGYAYRSLKEVVTCFELCQRVYPATQAAARSLSDEGNQISRMTNAFMQKLDRSGRGRQN